MKRFKANAVLAVCLAIMLSVTGLSFAAEGMTNLQFADLLIKSMGAELPPGTEDLPPEEYFEVLANILAEVGIPHFVGANGSDPVTGATFVAVLYAMTDADPDVTPEEKLAYLIETYGMGWLDLGGIMTLPGATEILGIPGLAGLVAATYIPPAVIERVAGEAAGFVLEEQEEGIVEAPTPSEGPATEVCEQGGGGSFGLY